MLPFFFINEFQPHQKLIILDEANSRHAIQVLRMKPGEQILLTDGKGLLINATITNDHKKHCEVTVIKTTIQQANLPEVTVAISLTKNLTRFEWFLEKATELGVNKIIPLVCHRTEKQRFKQERFHSILVSAMLQSQQCHLPEMPTPQAYSKVMQELNAKYIPNKYIAHCVQEEKTSIIFSPSPSTIFIGPEGDFTHQEIEEARSFGYRPVTLGDTRLRTETAGVVAASLLRVKTN